MPLRFDYPVFQETERTKMLRWVQVTPDESEVVYQTLGHIYVKNLKSGEIRQLTKGSESQAFYPNLSSDGKSVVYVSWNDQNLGKIRVVPLKGRQCQDLGIRTGSLFGATLCRRR